MWGVGDNDSDLLRQSGDHSIQFARPLLPEKLTAVRLYPEVMVHDDQRFKVQARPGFLRSPKSGCRAHAGAGGKQSQCVMH